MSPLDEQTDNGNSANTVSATGQANPQHVPIQTPWSRQQHTFQLHIQPQEKDTRDLVYSNNDHAPKKLLPQPPPAVESFEDIVMRERIKQVKRLRDLRDLHGPIPTWYQHIDSASASGQYIPDPRFQYEKRPDGDLPIQEMLRDLILLEVIYPEHTNLFRLLAVCIKRATPQDERVLESINSLPHLRYMVGLCRECYHVTRPGRRCCGQLVP